MKQTLDGDYSTILNKKVLDSIMEPQHIQKNYSQFSQNNNYYISNSIVTNSALVTQSIHQVKNTIFEKLQANSPFGKVVHNKNHPKVLVFIPIEDISKQSVGYFISTRDDNTIQYICIETLIKFFIAVLLILLIFYFYKQNINKVNTIKQLQDSINQTTLVSKTNLKGQITYVNDAFVKLSGYSKEELIGKPHSIVRHSSIKKETFKEMWHTIQNGDVWSGKITNRKKNGDAYIVNATIFPIKDVKGKIIEYTAIRHDITQQTKAEQRIREINKHTKDSIKYASLIQEAILPDNQLLSKYFKDQFIIWHPKDTVGGDIYLFSELRDDDECLLMYIDCTGHGVPGAFVTMLVKAVEREIVSKIKSDNEIEVSPGWVMGYFNRSLKKLLKQESKNSISNAGWDGGIIYYNKKTQILKFAGAETPLFYIDENKNFKTIKGNRYSVGYKQCDKNYEYKETIIDVQEGMKFYCTTDGYLDQNGGSKDFPFGKKRFSNIIKEHHNKPMIEQQTIFLEELHQYESVIANYDRNDDMTVLAFEI
jgi:PAS domain S-box-containing protein